MMDLQNTLFSKKTELDYTTPQLQKLMAFLQTREDNGEVWKAIDGYSGWYYASTYGNILTLKQTPARILKPQDTGKGYLYVDLEGQQRKIHRLIAITFLENPYHKPVVHHKDGNKHNNRLDNLQFATYRENAVYYQQEKAKRKVNDTSILPAVCADCER